MYRALCIVWLIMPLFCMAKEEAPELYGRVWLALTQSNNELSGFNPNNKLHLENYLSFLGVRGKQSITNDVEILYQLEQGVNSFNEYNTKLFSPRNSFLGIKSNYGLFMFGRYDSIFKDIKGKTDIFEISPNDMAILFGANDRYADSLIYQSPELGLITFKFTVQSDSKDSDGTPFSSIISMGDTNLIKHDYYVSTGYLHQINHYIGVRTAAAVKLDQIKLGLQHQHLNSVLYHRGGDSFLASVRYAIGALDLKYQAIYDNAGLGSIYCEAAGSYENLSKTRGTQNVVGIDYHLTPRATLMADIAAYDGEYRLDGATRKFNDLLSSVAFRLYF